MPVVSCSFDYHAGDSTIWLGFTSILRENTWKMARDLPPLLSYHQTEDLQLDGYSRVPPCLKGTIHSQTSMPSPGFELMPYDTSVSVTNYYIN
ncbi:hypothetical protein TNCV_569081 [Trichonephila clavipes]|nr:hypothetical protein TNCV_569081 [Trichonephila clavipes]